MDETEDTTLDSVLWRIGDDKGRASVPKNVREILELEPGDRIQLRYQRTAARAQSNILPFMEYGKMDEQYRYQTSQVARNLLNLQKGDCFVASVRRYKPSPANSRAFSASREGS